MSLLFCVTKNGHPVCDIEDDVILMGYQQACQESKRLYSVSARKAGNNIFGVLAQSELPKTEIEG